MTLDADTVIYVNKEHTRVKQESQVADDADYQCTPKV